MLSSASRWQLEPKPTIVAVTPPCHIAASVARGSRACSSWSISEPAAGVGIWINATSFGEPGVLLLKPSCASTRVGMIPSATV